MFSIVIPVFNEEENVKKLYDEIQSVLKDRSFEIVFVDDGSTDKSLQKLKELSKLDKKVKVVKLLSNYGQSNAIAAGIEESSGSMIVTMDSDMQHDPRDIIPMIKKLEEGNHVVCGWRKERGSSDSFVKKTIPSKISNFLIRSITGVKLKDSTGGMRAFSKRVAEVIPFYGEMHRYLPILALWKGFKVTEIPINIRQRKFGKTKYNYKRIFRGFLDLMTIKFLIRYSVRPIHIFGTLGIFLLGIGFIVGIIYAYLGIFTDLKLLEEMPILLLGVLCILTGCMFLGFGFIADMISYESVSSQKRTVYIIDEVTQKK